MNFNDDLIQIAYKKLKSSVYFDKTQLILRDKLVEYEKERGIEQRLKRLTEKLCNPNQRETLFEEILSRISYHVFPKKLHNDDLGIISNYHPDVTHVEDAQVFIDLDVEGHILGVLWLMLIGYKVDKEVFSNSKGNRLRKTLYNEFGETVSFSPHLFEPYFQQYESWRDAAMDTALDCLENEQDAVILALDFEKFYYSLDISKTLMGQIEKDYINEGEKNSGVLKAINRFVYGVIEKYADLLKKQYNGRKILPIGFLPSNVLANYALRNFDKAILDGWNPIYYGRYVDDILIVDKIEDQSDLYTHARSDSLTKDMVLHYYLEECATWKGINGITCGEQYGFSLFKGDDASENGKKYYRLRKCYNPTKDIEDKTQISLNDEKVKVFYFKSRETDALITCFKKEIGRNKSEFRHLPEDEAIFQNDDCSLIYDLKNAETVNKFRGVTELTIDKYELSKLLGKILRVAGMVSDARENKFFRHLKKIFNNRVIIENYTVWEKIIEVLVINESYSALTEFLNSVIKAIKSTRFLEDYREFDINSLRKSLIDHLSSSISRASALVWNNKIADCLRDGNKDKELAIAKILRRRRLYCHTRMIDKSVIPALIDMIYLKDLFKGDYNLTNYSHVLSLFQNENHLNYKYYPYLVNSYDLSNIKCMQQLKGPESYFDFYVMYSKQQDDYIRINYFPNAKEKQEEEKSILVGCSTIKGKQYNYLQVLNEKRSILKIGIANVKTDFNCIERVVKDDLNRSYRRYVELARVVNMAIDEGVDLLVMPEAYLPIEWINTLARTCAKNDLAVVTGVEHIKVPSAKEDDSSRIYNLTAIILPFVENKYQSKNAAIAYHLKNHYAPLEKMIINGYRLHEVQGERYELYKWHGCYFTVFCCYELASISDRALFQSYDDILIAIEGNKDIKYFSNIMESLSRDMHCYCVQVNTSEYGDSRITAPVKSEIMDVVRTKGGINSTILVGEVDIGKLREFQIKEYTLQKNEKLFKPTPPGFNPDIVMKKIKDEAVV